MDEAGRIMRIKSGLVQMTATAGWAYFKQMAQNLIERTTGEALDEEDASKRDGKVLKASALRRGLNDLFAAVEFTKQVDPNQDANNDFSNFQIEESIR